MIFTPILAYSECHAEFARMSEGFYHALEDLKPDKAFVVYQGKERYPISENIEAINLLEMAALLADFSHHA